MVFGQAFEGIQGEEEEETSLINLIFLPMSEIFIRKFHENHTNNSINIDNNHHHKNHMGLGEGI